MELSSPKITNLLIFSQKRLSYILEAKISSPDLKKLLLFQEGTFQAQKSKENPLLVKALKILIKMFYTINKTPFKETGCLNNLSYLLTAQASSFLIQPPFLNAVSQDTFGNPRFTMQYLCHLQDSMPHHWSPSISNPTLIQGSRGFPQK